MKASSPFDHISRKWMSGQFVDQPGSLGFGQEPLGLSEKLVRLDDRLQDTSYPNGAVLSSAPSRNAGPFLARHCSDETRRAVAHRVDRVYGPARLAHSETL